MTNAEIADWLESHNALLNDGRGCQTIKYIISSLRRNNRDEAELTASSESDKLWAYPEARKFIHQNLVKIGYWENGKMIRD